METKENPLTGGEKNNQPQELLKIKINQFLINYFNYLIFILAIAILAAGLFIFIYPKYQKISLENEVVKNNFQVGYKAEIDYLDAVRNLKKSYQLISADDRKKIANLVPAEDDNGHVITEMESLIARNSAILSSIKIELKSAAHNPNIAPAGNQATSLGVFEQLPQGVSLNRIEINLSSVSYPVLKNIIKSLENNLKLFDITQVSFNSKEDKAALIIYSYYFPR